MVKINSLTLENIQRITERKRRVLVEKLLIGLDVAHRESPSGYGREWEIRGVIAAATLDALNVKEEQYVGLADKYVKTLDFEDGTTQISVFIADSEVHEIAGHPLAREYVLRLVETA